MEILLSQFQQEIRAGLAQMCTYLPTAKCTSFVETYEGPIVDFFLHKVDPTKICSEIGACKPLDISKLSIYLSRTSIYIRDSQSRKQNQIFMIIADSTLFSWVLCKHAISNR